MNWLNIDIKILRSESFGMATNDEIAIWLKLVAYCCDQENGGIIRNAVNWSKKMWLERGVPLSRIKKCKHLLRITGNDIVVDFYPISQQETLNIQREAGKIGAKIKAEKRLTYKDTYKDTSKDTPKDNVQVKEGKGSVIEKESPPNPHGGLSEGELRFLPLYEVLSGSGKVSKSMTVGHLAVFWQSAPTGADPVDEAWLVWLKAQLALLNGNIGSGFQWLKHRAEEFFGKNKNQALYSMPANLPPPAEEM